MNQPGDPVIHPVTGKNPPQIESVPIMTLRVADSPRLNGEDEAHVKRLAEADAPLPPILVDRRTMRVIDGMHRLMAASLRGHRTIEAEFFDGSEADVFLRAVQENIAHGLPLTKADRVAATERIISTHPQMSDRAIGHVAGLAAKTVAAVRKRSVKDSAPSAARVGRDGKVRPLDSSAGRRRAAELLTDKPDSSLRDVARAAGISPATVLDVRKRLERGDAPVPGRPAGRGSSTSPATPRIQPAVSANPAATVEKLLRDPALRHNERGKSILRLLQVNAVSEAHLPETVGALPPHCVGAIVQLSRHYSQMWQQFAHELDGRARVIDPSAADR